MGMRGWTGEDGRGDEYEGCVFQAEDGIRGAQESRGLGDVYRGQDGRRCQAGVPAGTGRLVSQVGAAGAESWRGLRAGPGCIPSDGDSPQVEGPLPLTWALWPVSCLAHTSDAADE